MPTAVDNSASNPIRIRARSGQKGQSAEWGTNLRGLGQAKHALLRLDPKDDNEPVMQSADDNAFQGLGMSCILMLLGSLYTVASILVKVVGVHLCHLLFKDAT